ncbi:MAG TPA: DinB family protein [Candidatus Acidoferrum sp.]|nr:DinB family protein [Candidatus Acidoferrum sp.]
MCPFCIGSTALLAGSVVSAGGLTSAVLNKLLSKSKTKGAVMKLADTILLELDQEAETTRRLLDRIPSDKLSWKPHPKAFSLGQLALHIASVPGSVTAAAVPDSMEAPSFAQPEAKSRQEILDTFSRGLESARDMLKKMDDARLNSTWSLTKNGKILMTVPRIAFLRSILMNHNYHHRGQLSVYLRMLDVPVPSIYGPSADENPFA